MEWKRKQGGGQRAGLEHLGLVFVLWILHVQHSLPQNAVPGWGGGCERADASKLGVVSLLEGA